MAPISDGAFEALLRERSVMWQRISDTAAAVDALERSGAGDNVMTPIRESLIILRNEFEPFSLHYELQGALRNLGDKQQQLATLQGGSRALVSQQAALGDAPISRGEIEFAEEQVENCERAIKDLEAAIAAHPVAKGLGVAEPTSSLTSR